MSLAAALVAELGRDPGALDELAEILAPCLPDRTDTSTSSPWLDVAEAAAYLRCGKQRIYDLRHQGTLAPHRDGRRLLFHRDDLDAHLGRPR